MWGGRGIVEELSRRGLRGWGEMGGGMGGGGDGCIYLSHRKN